eukprot:m.72244 g.72244  ORF g.72244 m.72244 type:complete len:80 (+) comp14245_c0_seq1:2054-2293(+)
MRRHAQGEAYGRRAETHARADDDAWFQTKQGTLNRVVQWHAGNATKKERQSLTRSSVTSTTQARELRQVRDEALLVRFF